VMVGAGDSAHDIVAATWRAIARSNLSAAYDHASSARRVLFFHKLIFRAPATVVLRAVERQNGDNYAQISGACRAIVATGSVRVVVDASHNSLDESARLTKRERVMQVEPMPRRLTVALTGLEDLHTALAAAGLADVVWAVLGGYPADYRGLLRVWRESDYSADIAPIVEAFLRAQLLAAIQVRIKTLAASPSLHPLFERFTSADAVPEAELLEMALVRPSPDKVLRCVGNHDKWMLVPATPAMALVLRHKLTTAPPLDTLKTMV
jgi:hypothetical protein